MSLPDLPDIFGNYVLGEDFNEVVSPEAVNWLPQTPGWYVVGAIALAYAARYSWRRLRYWYRNRYRKEARQKLAILEHNGAAVAAINQVLKLSALAAFPREEVARLSGTPWVDFLNSRCEAPVFDSEQAQLLAEAVYTDRQLDARVSNDLIAASQAWLNLHRNRYGD